MKSSQKTEIEQAKRSVFVTEYWPVYRQYQLIDGLVCPIANNAPVPLPVPKAQTDISVIRESYLPIASPEVLRDFAAIATAANQEQAALEFVRRFGLLWYRGNPWHYVEPYLPPDPQSTYGKRFKHLIDIAGDPIRWIIIHATQVQMILSLWELWRENKVTMEDIENWTDTLFPDDPHKILLKRLEKVASARELLESVRSRGLEAQFLVGSEGIMTWHERAGATAQDQALDLISTMVTENLRGIRSVFRLESEGGPHLRQGFAGSCLLDFIYWHLADAEGKVRRCARCGKFFIATHRRMRFCPPSNTAISSCRALDKVYKSKARKEKAIQLAREGKSAAYIAKAVGSKSEIVRGWIGKTKNTKP